MKGINTWAVPHVRYSGLFLKLDQRIRKLMTMHKALHPRDDVDRLYVPRKEGGRGLTSIKVSNDASIQQEDCIKRLITATKNNTYNTSINKTKINRKQKCEEKQLYGYFNSQTNENLDIAKGNLKRN